MNPNCVEMNRPTVHPAMGNLGPINELCLFLPYKKWWITGKPPTYGKIMAASHCKIFFPFYFKAWQSSFLTISSKTTAFFPISFHWIWSLKFFFKINCMCMHVLPACRYLWPCVQLVLRDDREDVIYPRSGFMDGCNYHEGAGATTRTRVLWKMSKYSEPLSQHFRLVWTWFLVFCPQNHVLSVFSTRISYLQVNIWCYCNC